jgi:hypothetical protein
MENSIPSSGLVLLVHPLELSCAFIRSNIFYLKSLYSSSIIDKTYLFFRTHTLELDTEMLSSDNLNSLDISHNQCVYFDMSKLIYNKNFEKSLIVQCLRKIEAIFQKKQVPIFASIRDNLLCNDYLYLISKAIIISSIDYKTSIEERFSEPNIPFNVSIISKPGSGKLEVDDRFEFSTSEGFKIKNFAKTGCDSDIISSKSCFNMELKKSDEQTNISEAKIFVEDSDRDSENEMEADADF